MQVEKVATADTQDESRQPTINIPPPSHSTLKILLCRVAPLRPPPPPPNLAIALIEARHHHSSDLNTSK